MGKLTLPIVSPAAPIQLPRPLSLRLAATEGNKAPAANITAAAIINGSKQPIARVRQRSTATLAPSATIRPLPARIAHLRPAVGAASPQ
jgi:hypothetical protein